MHDLGSLGNDPIRANAINDRGQIVGLSGVNKYVRHAFVWQNGNMEDLNRLIAADGRWQLREAYDINNRGQILCSGTRAGLSGDQHLVLLNPSTKLSARARVERAGSFSRPADQSGAGNRLLLQ